MPILLTIPWNPGNYDPGTTYPRAKIVSFFHNTEIRTIRVVVDFGDVVEGRWVSGPAVRSSGKGQSYTIKGEDYDAMIVASPNESETVYDAVKRLLYAYLIEEVSELEGTVE